MHYAVSLETSVFTRTSMGPNLKKPSFRGHFRCPLMGHRGGVQPEHIQAGRLLYCLPCATCNLLNVFWEIDSSLQHKNLRWQTICLGRKKSKGAYGMDRTYGMETDWAPIAVASWCTALMEQMAHFKLRLPYLGHRYARPECRTSVLVLVSTPHAEHALYLHQKLQGGR